MKLTKSELRQIILEEVANNIKEFLEELPEGPDPMWNRDDVSNLPASMSAHRFSATPIATLADVASQKDRIKELHTMRDNLLNKINQYVEDYQNVGPAGESDFGGLRQTPQWIELYDFLKGMQ